MYYDKFLPFYMTYADPSLYSREQNTGAGICSDEILLSGNCPQNSGKS